MNHANDPSACYVDSRKSLDDLCRVIADANVVALDTEADSLHRYSAKVCLIQLSARDTHYIVDPLAELDLHSFLEMLRSASLILHGGDYDLRMLRASFGFEAQGPVFDTLVAAQLLGFEELGLAAVVDRYLNIQLSKKGQKSDWSRRPLSDEQLDYACDDTRYLESVAESMREELARLGRLEWHRESCQAMVASSAISKPAPEADHEWRVKGLSYLTRQELAYVRALWYWRDDEARRADRPPFKIMPNQLIIDLAIRASANPDTFDLDKVRLPRHVKGRRHRALESVFSKVQTLPESEWPQPRKPRAWPFPKPKIGELKTHCAEIAAELGIDPAVIAPRASLEAIVRHRSDSVDEIRETGSLLKWQAELIVPAVKAFLEQHPPSDQAPAQD